MPPGADYVDVIQRMRRYRDDRDWSRFHTPKDLAIAVSTEAGELLEHFLWRTPSEVDTHLALKRDAVLDEVADVAIYLTFLCDAVGADLLEVIERKLEHNLQRHPLETARGRSRPNG